jgi:PDZ domain
VFHFLERQSPVGSYLHDDKLTPQSFPLFDPSYNACCFLYVCHQFNVVLVVIVCLQVNGSVAHADGRLMSGDQIIGLNGADMTDATQELVAEFLKVSSLRTLVTCHLTFTLQSSFAVTSHDPR